MAAFGIDVSILAQTMRKAVDQVKDLAILLAFLQEREDAELLYSVGRVIATVQPDDWDVFCVTTNEGRCRVVSRPRFGGRS